MMRIFVLFACVGLVFLPLLGCASIPTEKIEAMQSAIDDISTQVTAYDAQIDGLVGTLEALREAGVAPEVITTVTDSIREAKAARDALVDYGKTLQVQLEQLKSQSEGSVSLWQLILAVVGSIVGSPLLVRYTSNRFLTRGVLTQSKA